MSFKRVIGFLLLFIGALVIAIPFILDWYNDNKANMLLKEYSKSITNLTILDDESDSSSDTKNETIQSESNLQIQKQYPVETVLSIPKINFQMPVIKDATKAHLNVSISSINGTAKPWEKGNYVIAGHRSLRYGRHFNRLNEVAVNDEIIVFDMKNNEYHYRVNSTEIVSKREVSVLKNTKADEITLITCDPIYEKNPQNRLVVKAIKLAD
ncbi:class D sortase [Paludicola sp. MB14-C6]|uniref:class D sortase n=1 Tax=Paludihabitans sp. MB14-C6 TaxID=3070656 RepID=UPI0027DC0ECA|nr:class D sortase [Paludicola sp. MB14-C6]WMJ22982.1 class D sortase [Paludicola sp. MB14-C6]